MNLKLKINNICEFDFTVLWVKERDGRWERRNERERERGDEQLFLENFVYFFT